MVFGFLSVKERGPRQGQGAGGWLLAIEIIVVPGLILIQQRICFDSLSLSQDCLDLIRVELKLKPNVEAIVFRLDRCALALRLQNAALPAELSPGVLGSH